MIDTDKGWKHNLKQLKKFKAKFEKRAQEIEDSPGFVWRMAFLIFAVMGLMFASGALLAAKWCDAQVEDRINIILNEARKDQPLLDFRLDEIMTEKNITNISEWSKEEYEKLKNKKNCVCDN